MILWNIKIKKSMDVINAICNQLLKEKIETDGVVETFNNGIEQGCILKVYDRYNPNIDLCFWIYLANAREKNNQMTVVIGKHCDCNEINMWKGNSIETYTFEDNVARQMHNKTRDFIIDKIKTSMEKTRNMPKL